MTHDEGAATGLAVTSTGSQESQQRKPTRLSATLGSDLGMLGVAAVWGSSYAVMQIVTAHGLSVPSFLTLRFVTAVVPLLALSWRQLRGITMAEIRAGVVYGAMLFTILVLETTGVQYTSAANAGFLITASVVLVPVLDRVLGGRRQARLTYLLTIVALAGCGLLSLGGAGGSLAVHVGDFVVLAAAAVRSVQIFLFGRSDVGTTLNTVRVTFVEVALVAVLGLVTSPLVGGPLWSQIQHVDPVSWALIAYLGVFGTAYAFGMQLYAARASSATRVAILMTTEPVFAALFAVLLRGEQLSAIEVIGGFLIVVSAGIARFIENRGSAHAQQHG